MANIFPNKYSEFGPGKAFFDEVEQQGYVDEYISYKEVLFLLSIYGVSYFDYKTLVIDEFSINDKVNEFKDWFTDQFNSEENLNKSQFVKVTEIEDVEKYHLEDQYRHYDESEDKHTIIKIRVIANVKPGTIAISGSKGVEIDVVQYKSVAYFRLLIPYSKLDETALIISSSQPWDFMYLLKIVNFKYSTQNKDVLIKIFKYLFRQAGDDRDKLDIIYFWAPDFVLNSRKEGDLWKDLKLLLEGNVDSWGTDEETGVLKILSSLASVERIGELYADNPKATAILDKLRSEKVDDTSVFELLYAKMNDYGGENNFTALINQLLIIWLISEHYFTEEYKINYTSEKSWGFYATSHDFKITNWGNSVQIIKPRYLPNGGYIPEVEDVVFIYRKVVLQNASKVEVAEIEVVPDVMPAFYLKALDDKNATANLETGIFLAIDILTSLTGFGNLLKFRHLFKVLKMAEGALTVKKGLVITKIVISGLEISSGAIGAMLTLSNDCNSDFCKKLRICVFYMDLLSLSGDALTSRLLKKSAREALELSKTSKNIGKLTQAEYDDIIRSLEKLAGTKIGSSKLANTQEVISAAKKANISSFYNSGDFIIFLKKARKDNISLEEFTGFIKVGNIKKIKRQELLMQMQGYQKVLKRGYPFKFKSLGQFNRFSKDLLTGLKKIGLPIDNVRIQGSCLRKAPPLMAKDIDIAVFVNDDVFNDYLRNAFSGKIKFEGAKLDLTKLSNNDLSSLAEDIALDLSRKKYNATGRTFSDNFSNNKISALTNKPRIISQGHRDLIELLNMKYPNLNIEDISVQTIGGKLNLKPDLKIN